MVLLQLFSPKTTVSCFKLFDVQSRLCHCGMMPASTNNPDLTPCGNSHTTRNSGLFSFHKTTAVVPAPAPDFFIKEINHGGFMEQEKCCSLPVSLMVLMSLHWCKAQILLWELLIILLSLCKLGRGYILRKRFFFFNSSRNSNRMFVKFGKIGPLGVLFSSTQLLFTLPYRLTQKQQVPATWHLLSQIL